MYRLYQRYINFNSINSWPCGTSSASDVNDSRGGSEYVTGFGKIDLNAANNFFQYPPVKPYGSIFFKKKIMAEMDRNQ